MTTSADLAAACARHGWTLEPDGDGWTLLGNGASFGSTESLAVWLVKQGEGKMCVPKQMPGSIAANGRGTTYTGVQDKRYKEIYTMTDTLKAPFPWPGGKSDMAAAVWSRMGVVDNYCEPFAGSSAMLLGRPGGAHATETVNDIDGLLINAYRCIQFAPDETAELCDWPVSESDLTSRHLHLKAAREDVTARLFADPLYCDPLLGAWWLWGIASWIGDGWCVADGPWIAVDGRLVDRRVVGSEEAGVKKQMPVVAGDGDKRIGRGIQSYRAGVPRKMPEIGRSPNGQMPNVTPGPFNTPTKRGIQLQDTPAALAVYFTRLADRLRRVRFLCGDWRRCVKDSVTVNHGLTAVFLDPLYPQAEHDMGYHSEQAGDVWHDAAAWAIERGDDKRLRICIAGYYSEATDALFPATWERVRWEARGGYANQKKDGRGRENAKRECLWFSPHCIDAKTDYGPLFAEMDVA